MDIPGTLVKSYVDKSYDAAFPALHQYCLKLTPETVSWVAFNKSERRFLALQEFHIEDALANAGMSAYCKAVEEIVTGLFPEGIHEKISIIVENNISTLVPDALYEPGRIEKYLGFNHFIEPDQTALSNAIPSLKSHNLFMIDEKLFTTINTLFNSKSILHHSTILIESILARIKNQSLGEYLFIHFRKESFDLLAFRDDKLIFSNNFAFTSKEDFIYFTLFTLDQLNINPESSWLEVAGSIMNKSDLHNILEKYIRNVKFALRNTHFEYSYAMDDIPSHFFYTLLNSCE